MNVLFTGLNGLIGVELSQIIIKNVNLYEDVNFYSISRSLDINSEKLPSFALAKEIFLGDCNSLKNLLKAINIAKPDLIIHMAQILYSEKIIKAVKISKLNPHFIIVGTTGVYSRYKSCSQYYKHSEKILFESGLTYNLIRPSMIYGSIRDKNIHKLMDKIIRGFPIPLVNNGKSLFQPVFYKDISLVIYKLFSKFHKGKFFKFSSWNCVGPDKISLRDMCRVIARIAGKESKILNLPYYPIYLSAYALEIIFRKNTPLKSEQVLRLKEDKIYNSDMKFALDGDKITSFEEGIIKLYENFMGLSL